MDALVDHKSEVDEAMAALLRPLVDQDLAMVFYDMTTIRAGGLSEQDGDQCAGLDTRGGGQALQVAGRY